MFIDDTNLFLLDQNIEKLFKSMQNELQKISSCFKANEKWLNISKRKYSLFHSQNKKSEIPQHLHPLEISDTLVKRAKASKFLGVVLDKNLSWKRHIGALAVEISKNVGIIFRSLDYMNKNLLKQLYFSFIHIYRAT